MTTLEQAPVNDPSWEIWACSPWMQGRLPPRSKGVNGFDRFYEVHFKNQFHPEERTHFVPWLGSFDKPVYVFDDLGLPNQVYYPRATIEGQHGSFFFTSTVAWMQAHALHELQRGDQIGIWGVDMSDGTEYAHQKQGCMHFIALAKLMGVDVYLPPGSELLKMPAPYPDRYATEAARVFVNKVDQAEAEMAQITAHLTGVEANRRSLIDAQHIKRGEIEMAKALQRVLV